MTGPWWQNAGLAFECQRCRACCRGEPGFVWVNETDTARLAAHLKMDVADFARKFCRRVVGRISLRERPDGDCVLLGPEGCTVYESRPPQCRSFPFWPEHLASAESWRRLGRSCPGVDRGRVRGAAEIRAAMKEEEG